MPPSATAIEIEWCGRPRLALTEPSSGSITTSVSVPPKSTVPALLADGGEAQALVVQPGELVEHRVLGRGVDHQRAVAALPAGPDLGHALGRGGPVAEDAAQLARRTAADAQPVGVPGGIGGSHRAYPTVVSPTPRQLEAIAHPGGPLLVLGGAGTGKTTVLCERFAWLVREGGLAPESILVLTVSDAGAAGLRERLETSLDGGFDELTVTTVHDFCARLLHDEALEAGLDPFAAPVTPADRIAMLLERIDELPLASHDLRGNPSALLGSIVGRIDRLKDELVSHDDYAAWAGTLGPEADREREFAALYATHDRMLEEGGTLDFGDLLLNAFRLLRSQPRVRARVTERYRHLLVDELQDANFAQGLLMRLLAGEHGQVSAAGDDDQAIHRLRGAAAKNLRDFEAEWPAATIVRLEESHRCPERVLTAARAVAEPAPDRIEKELRGRDGRRGRVLAVRERARAGAGGRRRDRAAGRARGGGARGHLRARALDPQRGPGRRGRAGGAGGAAPAGGRGGVLPARRGARPARLAAAAGRPRRRRRGRARARAPARRAAGHRHRPLHPDRAPPQARHGRRARRRARVAADPARGARAHPHVLQALPRGLGGAGLRAPRPLRPPADRAAGAAAPAAVRGVGRGRRAARQPRQVRRARRRLRPPLAAGHRARVRPLDRRRRRRRAARGGGGGRRPARRRAGDGHARGQGPRVQPRLRARRDGRAHPRAAPAHARADPRRAAQGGAAGRHQGGPRGRDAAAAAHGDDARAGPARDRLPREHRARQRADGLAVRRGGARGGRRRVGGEARGALRPGRDAAVDLPAAARRAAHHGLAGRRPARGAALRHRPRRLPRRRALPRADQARGAARARRARRPADRRRGAARGQHAAAAGRDLRAARDLRDVGARRVPPGRRARREAARAGRRRAHRAVAGVLPAAPRRRADALGGGHRDLPDLPAEVQVRARLPDPERADDQPALRDPRPPGARALPRRRHRSRARCRSCSGCWRRAGAAAASATPRRSASCAPRPRTR